MSKQQPADKQSAEVKIAGQSGGVNIFGGNISASGNIVGRDKVVGDRVVGTFALHQLPSPPADFAGRTAELADLLNAVNTGGVTISGLQGLGGVGKTALALKLAEKLKPDYPDAQFYVDLKGTSPKPLAPKEAMAHVVRAYHPTAQLPEDEDDLRGLYLSVLHEKRALLLIDNARDAQQVQPLIPPPGCLLLVTSRQHFRLPGLVARDLDQMPSADARALLLKIAPRLNTENQEDVSKLAVLCGYLPLALEKVASALHVRTDLSPADYLRRLEDTRERLQLTGADAALQSSYDLLPEELQKRFRFLEVFPDTFDLAAVAAVWATNEDSAQDSLGELLSYSLINFEVSKRYRLHDLLRLFADQRLTAEERFTAQKRHAGHYLKILAVADSLYLKGGESVVKGLALFDVEWDNVQAGQTWAAAQAAGDDSAAELCWQYPDAAAYCLALRQHPRERIRWLEAALAAARHLKRHTWEGAALGNLGLAYDDLGEYRRAIEYHEKALAIDREIGDRRGEGAALGNLGLAYTSLGEYRRAIEYQELGLHTAREIGDRLAEGQVLANLGLANASLGDYHRAIEYQENALAIINLLNNPMHESRVLGNLGATYSALGEYRRAIEYHEQRLRIVREIGDRRGEGSALDNLGNAYASLGEYHRAVEYYEQVLQISRGIGDRLGEGSALRHLGNAFLASNDAQAAKTYFEEAVTIQRETGNRRDEGEVIASLGLAYASSNEPEHAIELYKDALTLVSTVGDARLETQIIQNLSKTYASLGRIDEALENYERALLLSRRNQDLSKCAEILIAMGRLARENRDIKSARRYWIESERIYRQVSSPLASAVVSLLRELDSTPALAEIERFLGESGAAFVQVNEKILQITSCQGKLNAYVPVPILVAPGNVTEEDVSQLVGNSRDGAASILVYREAPSALVRLKIAEARLRHKVSLIPVSLAEIERSRGNLEAAAKLKEYADRYLPGADLFDDRNAVADAFSFFGRTDLLNRIQTELLRLQSVGLFGLRKSGKTSVLLQLEPILSANAVVRIDLQKYEGRARYGGQIFGEILAAMAAKPNITGPVPPEFVSGFAKDVPAGELGFEFSRKFGKLVEVLSQSGYQTPIICALDEIERILPSSSHPKEAVEEFNSLFGTLRALSQEKRTLALLVTDVHPDCNRINQWQQQGVTTNPVYSFFKEMYLLPFGKEDTSDMLDGIGRLMGLELDESLIGTVYQASGGHPYLARQLASLVVSKTASERLDLVSGNQYVEQPFYYSAPLKNYFGENIWGDLSKRHFNSAMAVLRVLASSSEVEEIVSRESLEKKLGSVFSAGQLLDAFLWLTDVGLVVQQTNRGGNGYAMRLPLLRRWLQMEMTEREKAEWQLH